MKTLQIKTGRWHVVPDLDGIMRHRPVVLDQTAEEVALEIDEDNPPYIEEKVGTGIRLYDVVQLEGEEWTFFATDAEALEALALRIRETL